jgi:hypothetical protein
LEILSLIDNKLVGEIPSEIGQLTNLKELVLASNELTGTVPYQVTNLSNLSTFMVSDNNFEREYVSVVDGEGSMPIGAFEFDSKTVITDND